MGILSNKKLIKEIALELAKGYTHFFTEDDVWDF